MKRLKIATIAIILTVLFALLAKVVFAGSCSCGKQEDKTDSVTLNNGKVELNAHHVTYHNDNVYCIQYGQNMVSGTYERKATAVIDGDYVTLYNYNNNKIIKTTESVKTEKNNIMAALLSSANLSTGYATWESDIEVDGARSDVQIGIWHLWNDWVDSLPNSYWQSAFPKR